MANQRIQVNNNRVPMFLQKLYTIIEDLSTDDVISWSEDGGSFYVHSAEELAKTHLPHWFKHNKFASFVRQLNMYGFHKIPHLQQGLLASTEQVEFMHPYFRRGREDQLVFIERKKQVKPDPQHALVPLDGNGVEDVDAMVSTIRHTQTQIAQDLADLKQADRVLWDEAHKARQRYDQQQDAINRIVKFLASFVGQLREKASSQGSELSPRPMPVSRPIQQGRLMIEDGKRKLFQSEDESTSEYLPTPDSSPTTTTPTLSAATQPDIATPTSLPTSFSQLSGADCNPPPSPGPTFDTFFRTGSPLPNFGIPSPSLTNALADITPQEWAKVLGAFSDFTSSSNKLVEAPSVPLPEGLLSLDDPPEAGDYMHRMADFEVATPIPFTLEPSRPFAMAAATKPAPLNLVIPPNKRKAQDEEEEVLSKKRKGVN